MAEEIEGDSRVRRSMIMICSLLKWVAIGVYTLVFGLPAIFLSFFLPGSDIVPLFGKRWASLILKTSGVKLDISGMENLEKKNVCIYVANHQSYFDVFALVKILPARVRIVAKRFLFQIPIFGWSIRAAGYISVNQNRREDLVKSFDEAAQKIKSKRPVLFFAEGSRSPDGKIQNFKKGAFLIALKAGVPLVPISISGGFEIMPPGSFRIKTGTMKLVIDEPIETIDYSVSRLDELMMHAHSIISRNLESLQND